MLPRYRELAETLRHRIQAGSPQSGERLPGELTLAQTHAVSRQTVREALRMLASEGLIAARKGSGWWVAPAKVGSTPRRVVGFPTKRDDPVAQGIATGLNEVLAAAGMELRLIPIPDIDARSPDLRAVDGLDAAVFRAAVLGSDQRRAIATLGIPCVAIHHQEHEIFDTVCADYAAGSRLLVDRAVALGHRRIVFTAQEQVFTTGSSFIARKQGYVDAMLRHGLQPHVVFYRHGLEAGADPVSAMQMRFEAAAEALGSEPTCWFEGLKLVNARNLRRRLGDRWNQISLCGFADHECQFGPGGDTSLTSVGEPWYAVGRAAGARLVARLLIPDLAPTLTLVPTQLRVGSSLRPVGVDPVDMVRV